MRPPLRASIAVITLSGALVLACQESDMPTEVDAPLPNFVIVDGANTCVAGDPCEHFFFLPPIVKKPKRFNGDFNANLVPTIIISLLDIESNPACVPGDTVRLVTGDDVTVGNEKYKFSWKTGEDDLTDRVNLRICVKIGQIDLGYRDVVPVANGSEVPKFPDKLPIYVFTNGSTIPLEFRIEDGVLCENDEDCAELAVGPDGGLLVTNTGFAGLDIPDGALVSQTNNIALFSVPCDTASDGSVRHLPIDLLQFAGCYEVIAAEGTLEFQVDALVGVCFNRTAVEGVLGVDQAALLQIHHQRSDGVVEALPNAVEPAGVNCSGFAAAHSNNKLLYYARAGLRKVQRAVFPWIDPPALMAIDQGFGGKLKSGTPLDWALPAQAEIVSGTQNGFGVIGGAPRVPDPQVKVTDANGDPVAGATVGFRAPSSGGSLDFSGVTNITVPGLGSNRVVTDAVGVASVGWILGTNPNTLQAEGVGIGLTGAGGPFADHAGVAVDLGTGVLNFTGLACDNSAVNVNPRDATVGTNEYANSEGFSANLSGGNSAAATVYWVNDCDNLYLALTVERDEADKTNTLAFDFDNGNNQPDVGDNVIVFDGDSGELSDNFLTQRCIRRRQSACSTSDPDGNVIPPIVVGSFGNNGVLTTYEIAIPLDSGDDEHDFGDGGLQITGDQVGFFITLSLGSGAQGNTQFPGFREYLTINIAPPQ